MTQEKLGMLQRIKVVAKEILEGILKKTAIGSRFGLRAFKNSTPWIFLASKG